MIVEIDVAEVGKAIAELFKELGWERGFFFLIIGLFQWFLHRQYRVNLDARKEQIDLLAQENKDYRDRFIQLMDKQYGLKAPRTPPSKTSKK